MSRLRLQHKPAWLARVHEDVARGIHPRDALAHVDEIRRDHGDEAAARWLAAYATAHDEKLPDDLDMAVDEAWCTTEMFAPTLEIRRAAEKLAGRELVRQLLDTIDDSRLTDRDLFMVAASMFDMIDRQARHDLGITHDVIADVLGAEDRETHYVFPDGPIFYKLQHEE